MTPPRAILIDDGDLPGLVAAVLFRAPATLVPLHLGWPDPHAAERRRVVQAKAAALGHRTPLIRPAWTGGGSPDDDRVGGHLDHAARLLQAAIIARELGARRVIWPVQVGPDPGDVCRAVDLVTSVTDLVAHATPGDREVVFETPVLDLDDAQVVDLADDLGAPLAAFCPEGGFTSADPVLERARWRDAFRRTDVPWPWAEPAHAPA